MSGLLHGTSALRKSQGLDEARRARSHHRQKKSDGLEPVACRSVVRPVIRHFALAFIFFQVATTAALATQVVLFEDGTAAVAPAALSLSDTQAQPLTPFGAGRLAPEHLLIQIDSGKISRASSVTD
ncbi:hypothetical protein DPM33_32745 [Mesorhizobium hawassense]|uniref:Uncharacterized protein n=1 Tax=Mesorhizobium hawassense TaxID=1209954 RepID=A0A330H901_9HYPH|nr:hypothetical protein [Mesorhizobium hawassense]RAZ83159.1 hypothetical protein DPM33_32745 [Mesorhizobium hawassense]